MFTLHDIMWLLDPSYCTDSALRRLIQGTFYGELIPRSVEQATRIMTVSDHSRQAIEERFPEVAGRVHVTYNGLDPFFYPVPEDEAWAEISALVPPRRRFVLVVGQGSPYKNHAGALAGFLEAFRHDPQVYFVLVRRFERAPKPMYYPEEVLRRAWAEYRAETGEAEDEVDPDRFIAWGFRRLLEHRIPRYDAIARNWGVTVEAEEIEAVRTPDDLDALIARAIARRDAG